MLESINYYSKLPLISEAVNVGRNAIPPAFPNIESIVDILPGI
jgi:hypothetical protein